MKYGNALYVQRAFIWSRVYDLVRGMRRRNGAMLERVSAPLEAIVFQISQPVLNPS